MSWYKSLLGKLKEKFKVPSTELGSKKEIIDMPEDTRKILTDRNGEDLVCPLCENEDNETGQYFPIREGDKRSFHSDNWHKGCLRVFLKAVRSGDII